MTTNIHLRGIDRQIMLIIKKEAKNREMSVNSFVVSLIKKGLGLAKEREEILFHDLDSLAGTWNKKEADSFMRSIAEFEQIDKDLWK